MFVATTRTLHRLCTHRSVLLHGTRNNSSIIYRSVAVRDFLVFTEQSTLPVPYRDDPVRDVTRVKIFKDREYERAIKAGLKYHQPRLSRELCHEYLKIQFSSPSTRIFDLLFKVHQEIQEIDLLVSDVELVMPYFDEFTESTFVQLLTAFSECDDHEKAKSAMVIMKDRYNIEPTVYSYNALLQSAESIEQAKHLLDQMKLAGCKENLQTYTLLLSIYAEEQNPIEVEKLIPNMMEQKVFPTGDFIALYVECLSLIPRYDNKQLADYVLHVINEVGLPMEQLIVEAFALYFSAVHSPEKGIEFLEECEKEGRSSPRCYWSVLQGFFVVEDLEGAYKMLSSLEDKLDFSQLAVGYQNLLELACVTKPLKAIDILAAMDTMNISTEVEVYDELLQSLLKEPHLKVFSSLAEVWKRGVVLGAIFRPDTMADLIKRASKLKQREEIPHILGYMYEQEMEISSDLIDIFNEPVSGVIDERAFQLPSIGNKE